MDNSKKKKKKEENNRTGMTNDQRSLQIIGDIKGIFHGRISMMRDKNCKDLKEAEETKKRWQEYTEELYKKGLNDLDNHAGVVGHSPRARESGV